MSAPQYLNLDDFADSPYADELRKGVSTRPFAPRLEALYVQEHLARMRPRIRIWFLLTAVISLLYIMEKVGENGWGDIQTLLQLCAIFPGAVLLTKLAFSSAYRDRFMEWAHFLVPVIQVCVAAFVAGEVSAGSPLDLGGVVLSIVGLFIFSGLLFRNTVVVLGAVVIAFLIAASAHDMAPRVVLHSVLTILLTGGLVAYAHAEIERAYRSTFLNSRLISELAERDGLTNLRNRRAFDEHLVSVWGQAARDEISFAILMIDLDFFKAFNDTYGHPAGDAALRRISEIVLRSAQRPLDLAARYGGEELVLVLYDISVADARERAEKIRADVEALSIPHLRGTSAGVSTVSIGIAGVLPGADTTLVDTLRRADEALYQAKRIGRNRVVLHDAPERGLTMDIFSLPSLAEVGEKG